MHCKGLDIHGDRFPSTGDYPFNLGILKTTAALEFPMPVVFFAGENGSGKSTILEGLARACGIHIWQEPPRPGVRYNPLETELYRYLDVRWEDGPVPGAFFAADTFRHFALLLDEWAGMDKGLLEYFGGSSLVERSHGECNMAFFHSRFHRRGLYLLDEPETALSPRRQIELLRLLMKTAGEGLTQFVIATHSPILLAFPGAVIYDFNGSSIAPVDYSETEYFRVYRDFLNDPGGFLEGA